jgi:hypothetical protein
MNFNYSLLINKAWKIAWRNKLLWIFGFFITSGVESFNYRNSFDLESIRFEALQMIEIPRGALLIFLIVGLLFGVAFLILSVISHGAMIKGIDNVSKSITNRFKALWKFGVSKFWRVLAIELIIGIGVLLLLVPSVLALLDYNWSALVAMIWVFLVIVALVIFGNFFYYIFAYAVIEDKKAIESIVLAWKLYVNNFKVSFLVSLLRLGLSIAFGIGLLIATILAALPFVLLGFLFGYLTGAMGALITAIVAAVLIFALVIVVRGFLNTFHFSLSVYTFLELTGRKVLAEKKKELK